MGGFKDFCREDEDVKKSIAKLPKKHQELIKGFEFRFEPHNTLKGDKGHVGLITNDPKKMVKIAAPWRYSREHTVLHEIAHLVYEAFVRGTPLEKKWEKLAMSNKNRKKDENAEELFCHSYGATYSMHPVMIHHHPEWEKFIKALP